MPRRRARSSRELVRLGVAGGMAMLLAVGLLGVMAIPTFTIQDEPSHYGYAAELAYGKLPTLDTPIPVGDVPELALLMATRPENRRLIWTANHPPLFYLTVAAPIGVGRVTGHQRGGLRVARLFVLLFSLATVAATAWIARLLVPRRPDVAVVAACVAGLVPTFVATSSALFNDSLAVLISALALGTTIRWLVHGAEGRWAWWVVGAGTLAASSRVSGLLALACCLFGLLAGAWIHRRDRDDGPSFGRPTMVLHRWTGTAFVPMALLAAAALGASGWFWLRNVHLYGDLTGAQLLLERFERKSKHTTVELLSTVGYWLMQQRRLWDPGRDYPVNALRGTRELWKLTFVPIAGLAVAAVTGLVAAARGRQREPEPIDAATVGRRVAWAMGAVFVAAVHVSAAQFSSQGGGAHPRYLWPAAPFVATVLAIGLVSLPGARRGITTVGFLALMLVANVWGLMGVLKAIVKRGSGRSSLWFGLQVGTSMPALVIGLVIALCAAGLAAVAVSLWGLGQLTRATPATTRRADPVRMNTSHLDSRSAGEQVSMPGAATNR